MSENGPVPAGCEAYGLSLILAFLRFVVFLINMSSFTKFIRDLVYFGK